VTYEEAAEELGGPKKPVSVRHVERLVAAKKLKAVGRGRARRIVYASILAYIEREGSHG
jgi:excisionase family DNA binding protein